MYEKKRSKNYFHSVNENFPPSIMLTDRHGNILFANTTAAFIIDMPLDTLQKSNVSHLLEQGYYDHFYTFEVLEQKNAINGFLSTRLNYNMFSINTPILDKNGQIILVLTLLFPPEEVSYDQSKEKDYQRKTEIEYLRRIVLDKDMIIAASPLTQKALLAAHTVAQTDSSVFLLGETGTGKEIFAKYIHRHSKRANGPFIDISCATFPEQLMESELFGYEKGAFSGAKTEGKMGLVEAADQGTLFLDEVAELPMALQAKLLRVLETGEIRRVGSCVNRSIDFRLISATHKDLEKLGRENLFRPDLYFRLNAFPITIPPLRERPEDIEPLSEKFLEEFNRKYDLKYEFDQDTLKFFKEYDWPGNIREMRNTIERYIISSLSDYDNDNISLAATNPHQSEDMIKNWLSNQYRAGKTLKEVVKSVEKSYIECVLQNNRGRIGLAADKLGIYRTALYRKLKSFQPEWDKK